ncbi:cellulose binding domain-containing protein [Micromonospora sp. NBRC 110038]|uniref:cellulose binding domain-containing protein n=1 Tax=Micromonospora sp. NBRC 110038 TaxID=1550034 RepID=UPI001E39AA1E|nr:cellulose binding domain-containing protein [Micromonospora sp. NBRC 110038]
MNRPRPRLRPGLLALAGALLLAPVAPGLASAATAAEAAGAAGAAAPPAVVPIWTPAPPTPSTTPMNPGPTPTTGAPHPTDYPTPTPTSSNPTDPPSPTPTTAIRCSATWRLVSDWPGAFHAEVTVHSTGTSPMARWAVRLTLPEGQGVRDIWSATIASTIDDVVTISNADWNGRIAPGASTAFGLIGTGPATAPALSCIAV